MKTPTSLLAAVAVLLAACTAFAEPRIDISVKRERTVEIDGTPRRFEIKLTPERLYVFAAPDKSAMCAKVHVSEFSAVLAKFIEHDDEAARSRKGDPFRNAIIGANFTYSFEWDGKAAKLMPSGFTRADVDHLRKLISAEYAPAEKELTAQVTQLQGLLKTLKQ